MAKAPTKAGKKKTFKRKERRLVPQGIVHIQASFNNTLVSITDLEGNLISQSS
jgi:small subunit ribosomal protein S11